MPQQMITKEKVISPTNFIHNFDALSKEDDFYRIVNKGRSLGVFLPEKTWKGLTEDLEALISPNYLISIREARREEGGFVLGEIKAKYNIK
ncbi:MAG: hypothetical protein ABIG90_02135 [bacterium]